VHRAAKCKGVQKTDFLPAPVANALATGIHGFGGLTCYDPGCI
jgi:hypothetical protein